MSAETLTTQVELALVGGVLVRGKPELAWLRSNVHQVEWGDARARAVIDAACEVADAGADLVAVNIAAALERHGKIGLVGGLGGLDALRGRDRPGERDALAKRVSDHARVRAMAEASLALGRTGHSPATLENPEAYFAEVSALAERARSGIRRGSVTARQAATQTCEAFVSWGKNLPVSPTRIPMLNKYLNGGYRPGKMTFHAARPGVGKTQFGVENMLYAAQRGHPQLVFSSEMPVIDLTGRFICLLADIDSRRWLKGPKEFAEREYRSILTAFDTFAKLPIEQDLSTIECGAMLASADVWLDTVVAPLRAENPGLVPSVWVDYIQGGFFLAGKFGSRTEMLGEFGSKLAGFTKARGVAMNVVAAINKDNVKAGRLPTDADLRECDALAFHANAIVLFHRDQPEPAAESKDDGEGQQAAVKVEDDGLIIVAKNREGPKGVIKATFLGSRGRWVERVSDWRTDGGAYAEH